MKNNTYIAIAIAIILVVGFLFYQGIFLTNNNLDNSSAENNSTEQFSEVCQNSGGNWISEFNECENGFDRVSCESLGGEFNECASACRNNPEAEFCTLQCVQVCKF